MTKEELQNLTLTVYATYDKVLHEADRKNVLRVWYDLLGAFEYEDAYRAFLNWTTTAKFIPGPGQLRRATIDAQTGMPPHLDGYSAWGIFVSIQKNAHFGTQTEIPRPEALVKTLERLGDSAYEMHTNGDREAFLRVYEKVVEELEQHKYKSF